MILVKAAGGEAEAEADTGTVSGGAPPGIRRSRAPSGDDRRRGPGGGVPGARDQLVVVRGAVRRNGGKAKPSK